MNPPTLFDPALLCCPETRQPLVCATVELVAKLEAARVAGRLVNRAGQSVAEPITAGLVRVDGMLFFPISAGIPLLVMDEALTVTKP